MTLSYSLKKKKSFVPTPAKQCALCGWASRLETQHFNSQVVQVLTLSETLPANRECKDEFDILKRSSRNQECGCV